MRFWISWEQPIDPEEQDYRPISCDFPKNFLGWWCSGYGGDMDYATLIALLDAEDLNSAKDTIKKFWPEVPPNDAEWRVENIVNDDYVPGGRFPLPEWSPLLKGKNGKAKETTNIR